jgi:hypothetical protein
MPGPDIAKQRLVNQGLVKPALKTAGEVVAKLGAVQAQDYGASKWGIAQRTGGLTDERIEKEIDDGMIVRTHVLRPTWHFVAAADIGWMLALSASLCCEDLCRISAVVLRSGQVITLGRITTCSPRR